jgi:hypothetical protein
MWSAVMPIAVWAVVCVEGMRLHSLLPYTDLVTIADRLLRGEEVPDESWSPPRRAGREPKRCGPTYQRSRQRSSGGSVCMSTSSRACYRSSPANGEQRRLSATAMSGYRMFEAVCALLA